MGKPKTPAAGARKTAARSGRAPGAAPRAAGAASRGTATRGGARGGRGRASAPVAPPAGGAAALPTTVTRIVQEHASGPGKRKNMFVPQELLDRARKALGVKTETEAVALGLGAAVDLAEFQHEMLAGFDRLMKTGGLSPVDGEQAVLDGFRARPAR